MRGRDVGTGTLGCPVCEAGYPIVDGIARFGDAAAAQSAALTVNDSPEEALRLGALLDLTAGRGLVVLAGEWGTLTPAIAALLEDVQVLLVNASAEILRAALPSGA